jgi:hypothetical protein
MAITLDGTAGITTPADTVSGNLTFTGTGNRITGDFSNATIASRVAFQTSTTNGNTVLNVIPNGTGINSNFYAFNNSDPTNSSYMRIGGGVNSNTESRIESGILGTGTYLPMTFYTNGSEQARISTAGVFSFNSGYGSAAAAYGCRAWVDFNGTGTVAIRGSGNVTSITDNAVGDYTINFTTAMVDANYAMTASSSCDGSGNNTIVGVFQSTTAVVAPTTSAARLYVFLRSSGGGADVSYVNAQILR